MTKDIWNWYPYSRPLNKPVEVLIDGKILLGAGFETAKSGGGILINGKLYDSNTKLQWRYSISAAYNLTKRSIS